MSTRGTSVNAAARVARAVAAIGAGRPVVVADDADREDEGDLVFAATHATAGLLAFTVRHTSGFVCVALPDDECDRLALPPMAARGGDRFGTAYRVTVDARGTGTGISATDRARTVALLGSPAAAAEDFVRPGHVVPLAARPGGVLERPGHTEAAVDLARLAGLPPAGALCEIVSTERPGAMARGAELHRFAAEHDLVHLTIADLAAVLGERPRPVRRAATTTLPTTHGTFRAIGYADGAAEHLVLVAGRPAPGVAVHVHTECLAGDVLRSTGCRCGAELDAALAELARDGGVLVLLRPAGRARACGLLGDGPGTGDPAVVRAILTDLGVGRYPAGQPVSTWARTAVPSELSQPFRSA